MTLLIQRPECCGVPMANISSKKNLEERMCIFVGKVQRRVWFTFKRCGNKQYPVGVPFRKLANCIVIFALTKNVQRQGVEG